MTCVIGHDDLSGSIFCINAQIDPEEHSKALAQVEEVKKELSFLQSAKENVDKECTSAKSLVSRLNKEVSKMKAHVESLTKNLEVISAEKDALAKATSDLNSVAKERDQLKTAKEVVESELESTKIENEGNKSRIENLTTFLRKSKASVTELTAKLQQATQAELEAKRSLAKEIDSHKSVLHELETVKASNNSIEPTSAKPTEALKPVQLATNDDVLAAGVGSAAKDSLMTLPQVPSEGFKFSPTPVSEQVFSSANDKLSLSSSIADDKGVNHLLTSDTSRPSSNISLKELAGLEPPTEGCIDPSNVESNDLLKEVNNPTLDNQTPVNESAVSSASAQIEDENAIREKLLKRKRDKKGQVLSTKTLEPPLFSLTETELKSSVTSSGSAVSLTNVTVALCDGVEKEEAENQEFIDTNVQIMGTTESDKGNRDILRSITGEELFVIEKTKDDAHESSISARPVEMSDDTTAPGVSDSIEEQASAEMQASETPNDTLPLSHSSKKRASDESIEVIRTKLPRLTQPNEDDNLDERPS